MRQDHLHGVWLAGISSLFMHAPKPALTIRQSGAKCCFIAECKV